MLKLLALLGLGFVAEIVTWIVVGQFISGWWIFLWTIVAFVWGLNMLRGSVGHIMPQLQQMQMTGQLGGDPQVQQALPKALTGFLLLLPGLLSDVLALLLLIPAVQTLMRTTVANTLMKRQNALMQKMMQGGGMAQGIGAQSDMMAELMRRMQDMQGSGSGTGNAHRPTIIDGEARTVEPEIKRIKPANNQ